MRWTKVVPCSSAACAVLLFGGWAAALGEGSGPVRSAIDRRVEGGTVYVEVGLANELSLASQSSTSASRLRLTGGVPGHGGAVLLGGSRTSAELLARARVVSGRFDANGALWIDVPVGFDGFARGVDVETRSTTAVEGLGRERAPAGRSDVAGVLADLNLLEGERAGMRFFGLAHLGALERPIDASLEIARGPDGFVLFLGEDLIETALPDSGISSEAALRYGSEEDLTAGVEAVLLTQAFASLGAEAGFSTKDTARTFEGTVQDGGKVRPPELPDFDPVGDIDEDPKRARDKHELPRFAPENKTRPFDGTVGEGGSVLLPEPPDLPRKDQTQPSEEAVDEGGSVFVPTAPQPPDFDPVGDIEDEPRQARRKHELVDYGPKVRPHDGEVPNGGSVLVPPEPTWRVIDEIDGGRRVGPPGRPFLPRKDTTRPAEGTVGEGGSVLVPEPPSLDDKPQARPFDGTLAEGGTVVVPESDGPDFDPVGDLDPDPRRARDKHALFEFEKKARRFDGPIDASAPLPQIPAPTGSSDLVFAVRTVGWLRDELARRLL